VVLDWFSRRVLSWRLSITMEASFCVETLEDALARHGKPETFKQQSTESALRPGRVNSRITINLTQLRRCSCAAETVGQIRLLRLWQKDEVPYSHSRGPLYAHSLRGT